MKDLQSKVKNDHRLPRRAPMLRSIHWAFLLGAVAGALLGIGQVYTLAGGFGWSAAGGLLGALLGLIVGCDLLIPGPVPDRHFANHRGSRVGPFRWGVYLMIILVEGLLVSAYLYGETTLTCQRLEPDQVNCRRTVVGWLNSRPIGEMVYATVIGAGLDMHDDLLLQHGPYQQSQSAPGFDAADLGQVQTFLAGQTPALTLVADGWGSRLAVPICLLLALLAGGWAFVSLRHGFSLLREQVEQGEVYWGWRRGLKVG